MPLVITEAVRFAVPGIFSINSPPFTKMLIAIISLTSFGVRSKVEPFASSYLVVCLFWLITFAGAEVLLDIFTSLQVIGKAIDTALLFLSKYFMATRFTSSAVTFLIFSR